MNQRQLEQEQMDKGRTRSRNTAARLERSGMVSLSHPGRKLLSRSINDMQDAVVDWLEGCKESRAGFNHIAFDLVSILPPDVTGAISCRYLIDTLSVTQSVQAASSGLGFMIENEVQWRLLTDKLRDDNKISLLKNTLKFNKHHQAERWCRARLLAKREGYEYEAWEDSQRVRVGQTLLYIFIEATGIIEIQSVPHGRGLRSYVAPTKEIIEWYNEAKAWDEEHSPVFMPMVERPKPWTTPYDGGYITDEAPRRSLVKVNDFNFLRELSEFEMPTVYHAVNALQDVRHKVNPFVLDVVTHLWENSHAVAGLPMRDDFPLPPKPEPYDFKTPEGKEWRKTVARLSFKNREMMGKRIQASRTILLAKKFVKSEVIHFPWQCDFRGRMYPVPPFLQPQGSDLAKGLLCFAEKKPIGDENAASWLAIHGANCYGVDKVSFEDRIKWVTDNQDAILGVANDPLVNDFWLDASDPFQFLAWCDEWAGYLEEGLAFESCIPVAMDGSNNGLQLFSLLLRDTDSAIATNVHPTVAPEDIYKTVADGVVAELHKLDDDVSKEWLRFGVDRKATKRATMTLPYGSTYFSCCKYVREWYYDRIDAGEVAHFEEPFKACNFLAKLIWEEIARTVTSAVVGMKFMREIAKVCVEGGSSIRWQSPAGFPVLQNYNATKMKEVSTSIYGRIKKAHRYLVRTDKVCGRRTSNGISPNMVHSIDASVAMVCTEYLTLNGVTDFNMVHDSFSTHACNAGILAGCLREAVVEIFDNDVLKDIRDQIQIMLPDHQLPELPEYGNLDPNVVRDSDYFFA